MAKPTTTRRLIRFAELKSQGVPTYAALRAAGLRTHNTKWVESHPVVLETRAALIHDSIEDHTHG